MDKKQNYISKERLYLEDLTLEDLNNVHIHSENSEV